MTTMVDIITKYGQKVPVACAFQEAGWAATQMPDRPTKWAVTHVATGLALDKDLSRAQAVSLSKYLVQFVPNATIALGDFVSGSPDLNAAIAVRRVWLATIPGSLFATPVRASGESP